MPNWKCWHWTPTAHKCGRDLMDGRGFFILVVQTPWPNSEIPLCKQFFTIKIGGRQSGKYEEISSPMFWFNKVTTDIPERLTVCMEMSGPYWILLILLPKANIHLMSVVREMLATYSFGKGSSGLYTRKKILSITHTYAKNLNKQANKQTNEHF